MRVVVIWLALVSPALAQTYPVQGRFACVGYDKTLSIVGDLASITSGATPQNNGITFSLPSRNVSLDIDSGIWTVETGHWNGSGYVWSTPIHYSIDSCAYYPEVDGASPDAHTWLSGSFSIVHSSTAGALTLWGYDGGLAIPGDLYPGIDNGVLFSLPIDDPHMIKGSGGRVWHGRLWITDVDGVKRFMWAVYPASVSLQELPQSWLDSIVMP